jgi:drug/metabolite transporter (DMT)-like permease
MNERRHHPVRGVLWMAAAAASFSVTLAMVRHLSDTFSTFEIVFFRQVFGMLFMLPWLVRAGAASLKTEQFPIYLLRAACTYSAMLAAYYSLRLITIADSIALQFTLPFFTIVIATVVLNERVRAHRWIATVTGFVGALIIIRPGFAEFQVGMVVAILAAAIYAAADICTRFLSGRDSVNVIVFYGFAIQLPVSAVPAALDWVTPGLEHLPWLVAFGIVSFAAQFFITRAFAAAEVGLVSPVLYLRLPFVALLGFLFFDELPDHWTWIGAGVLFASTVYSTRRDAVIARREAAA